MYEVTYVVDGVLKKMSVSAEDSFQATKILTNMYGNGFAIQIINVKRI